MARVQEKNSVEKICNKATGKGGRPKVLEGKKKNKPVTSYFTENEHSALSEFLKGNPHTISSFMRECALENMKTETNNKKKKDKKKSKKKNRTT